MAADTHTVFNQSPAFVDVDLFALDRPLQEAVAAWAGKADLAALDGFGHRWGSAEMAEQARLANVHPPILRTFDAKGFRRDQVEFHPAYHRLMTESIADGLHASPWSGDGRPAGAPAEVARAARFYIAAQVEAGHLCPITMTRAAVAALHSAPDLAEEWVPKVLSRIYDPLFVPWWDKVGVTLGMGMTEKQGGTDVRANTTRAEADGDAYRITGHKWFLSAPMCDAFLVLAQAPAGLTCFLMPRFTLEGAPNRLMLQRLKDKLGNRSNASAEVEFANAFAWRVGEEGRGIATILQMVQLTRLDCAIASAGLMRMALAQALHHARHRAVFGRLLAEQPLMQSVLADLALHLEGAVALVMRLARAFDLAADSGAEAARARLLTPAVKYWVCKTAPGFIYEAMECLGGNGYVEETSLARLYREAPVNAIWEGSGNVMCLDVLRVLARERDVAEAVFEDLAREAKALPMVAETMRFIRAGLDSAEAEAHARAVVERLAQLAAAAALAERGPTDIASLFARHRLGARGDTYGTGALTAAEAAQLIARALPET